MAPETAIISEAANISDFHDPQGDQIASLVQ
jgi:hypothetical protein